MVIFKQQKTEIVFIMSNTSYKPSNMFALNALTFLLSFIIIPDEPLLNGPTTIKGSIPLVWPLYKGSIVYNLTTV